MLITDFISETLRELKRQNLFREEKVISSRGKNSVTIGGKELINFASNDYLGLSSHPGIGDIIKAAADKYGWGSASSRLLSGTTVLHRKLEEKLAEFAGEEDAVLYNSGYSANLGFMNSFIEKGDFVFFDRLCHASLIDAIRLYASDYRSYPHLDTPALEEKIKVFRKKNTVSRILLVTDTVFSMDGDIAPLKKLKKIADDYDALLYLDEAHAGGVFGKEGRGLAEREGVLGKENVITMLTLSKAFASTGAFIAGKKKRTDFLRNRSRAYIYTTAMPLPCCAASIELVREVRNSDEKRRRLEETAEYLRDLLKACGFDTGNSESQIIPVMINNNQKALHLSEKLLESGFFVPAIRYPTVKINEERLRLSLTAAHSKEDCDLFVFNLKDIYEKN